MSDIEYAARIAEQHAERLKHTSHRDGLGMGWLSGEALCREIADLIRTSAANRRPTVTVTYEGAPDDAQSGPTPLT